MAARNTPQDSSATVAFSLRLKIILLLGVVSLVAVAGVTVYTLRTLSSQLFSQLQARVHNLTAVGQLALDRGALARLVERVDPELSADQIAAVYASSDFALLSQQLNMIRNTDPALVRYLYTFVPTSDPDLALFLVDADVLSAEPGEEDVSGFASAFDVSEFPVARRALQEGIPLVEPGYSYDADFDVNSLSGYAPIKDDQGRLLAVLGLDMVDTDVRLVLARTTGLLMGAGAGVFVLSLGASILVGLIFTRGIVSLDRVMREFKDDNLQVRASVTTRDEVGRLSVSFNQMAQTIESFSDQRQQLLNAYSRFVPQDFLRFLQKRSITDVKLGDQVQQDMTIMFSDIRSFTQLSEIHDSPGELQLHQLLFEPHRTGDPSACRFH